MSRNLLPLAFAASLIGSAAFAEAPRVATDITPVHSLVAQVMEGIGSPDLIVQSGASPHEYALRPSEAGALQDADLVFWIGPDLTPWLDDAIETLTSDAVVTALLDADGTIGLETRTGALFEAHHHDSDHEAHGDHGDDHKGHDDHESHEGHDDHGDEHKAHKDDHGGHKDEHAHGGHDPHAWLSPDNASAWLTVIAAKLSAADPENADIYAANAAAAQARLTELQNEISAILAPLRGKRFIVFHDAYQYFEVAFDLPAAGAISLSDASSPSPSRIAEIKARVTEEGITCVLTEPQFNSGLVATVVDGTGANTGIVDPLGASLEPGPALYPNLIRNVADSIAGCL